MSLPQRPSTPKVTELLLDPRYRVKVRDFAYEPPLLPPVQVVPRPLDALTAFMRRVNKRGRDLSEDSMPPPEPKRLKLLHRMPTHHDLAAMDSALSRPSFALHTSATPSAPVPVSNHLTLAVPCPPPDPVAQGDESPTTPVFLHTSPSTSPSSSLLIHSSSTPVVCHRRASAISTIHFSLLNAMRATTTGDDSLPNDFSPSTTGIASPPTSHRSPTSERRSLALGATSANVARQKSGLISAPT